MTNDVTFFRCWEELVDTGQYMEYYQENYN